ncbi:MAG: class I SAM-dependent methyltransferase [Vicinamibacterales bacterium]
MWASVGGDGTGLQAALSDPSSLTEIKIRWVDCAKISRMAEPYELSARFYDRIYSFRDYQKEAASLRALIHERHPSARTLIDVGCGTGSHLALLRNWFDVEGVDASAPMLDVARQKLSGVPLHHGALTSFTIQRRFDVVVCLGSGIGYVRSVGELNSAVANLTLHLAPGGLLIIEPWFTPEQWRTPGIVQGVMMVDEPELKVARFVVSETHGRMAVTPMHHLVATPEGVTHFLERHELFLATSAEYEGALIKASLDRVAFVENVVPRGAWVGGLPRSG